MGKELSSAGTTAPPPSTQPTLTGHLQDQVPGTGWGGVDPCEENSLCPCVAYVLLGAEVEDETSEYS